MKLQNVFREPVLNFAGPLFRPPVRKMEEHAELARARLKQPDPTGRGYRN